MATYVFPGNIKGLIRRCEIQALLLLPEALTEKGSFSLGVVTSVSNRQEQALVDGSKRFLFLEMVTSSWFPLGIEKVKKRNNEVYEFNLNEQAGNGFDSLARSKKYVRKSSY